MLRYPDPPLSGDGFVLRPYGLQDVEADLAAVDHPSSARWVNSHTTGDPAGELHMLESELAADRMGHALQTPALSRYVGPSLRRRPGDGQRLLALAEMAATARVTTVATGDVLYATPDRRLLQDVVTCIREQVSIDDAGRLLEANAERHLELALPAALY